MSKPTLHLMVGLPCSGKTSKAKELERKYNLIRLTPDEWQLRLFGDDFILDELNHNKRHEIIETIMWELAENLLLKGNDVILDFGFWAKEERISFFEKSKALNVSFKIHFMEVNLEELLNRLAIRNNDPNYLAFYISEAHMLQWFELFEPVSENELDYYVKNE